MEPILLKLQRPMAVNLRLEATLVGPDEGLRRHEELLTALETNDRDVVLEALCDHGGQRYLQFRRDAGGRAAESADAATRRSRSAGRRDAEWVTIG